MKKLMFLIFPLFLIGCSQSTITQTTIVVKPEESMYRCEIVENFPDTIRLRDSQVAMLLIRLHRNNIECRNSINAIREFLNNAEQRIRN